MGLGNTMVLDKALLGPTPKTLQAVNVNLAGGEAFLMVHLQVPVATEHEAVVALKLVRIDDRTPADLFDRQLQQGGCRDVSNDRHMDLAVALQDAQYRHFSGSASASVALAAASEVALIQLDLSAQQKGGILGLADNGQPDGLNGSVNGPISQAHLLGHLADGDLLFKELDQGQPLHTGQSSLFDPPSGELLEGILTMRATIASLSQFVKFSALAAGANPLMVFEAFSQQVFLGLAFAGNQPVVSF